MHLRHIQRQVRAAKLARSGDVVQKGVIGAVLIV
jgi:hypothetical protein